MEEQSANRTGNTWVKTVQIGYNASGAALAANQGQVVVIVDLVDMSTTAEAVLEKQARLVLGASPDTARPPVKINPEKMGYIAGKAALENGTEVILVAEPRWGTEKERLQRCQKALTGIKRSGAVCECILPNIGGEISKLTGFKDKVVLIVSDTGGVAFDAAYSNGAPEVLTATVCRTVDKKGTVPAEAGICRAIEVASRYRVGITFIAASANSYEDILAAEYLAKKVIEKGFLNS